MKVILGIGNPGLEYRNTRHNLGFIVLDSLAKELDIQCWSNECSGLTARGHIQNQEVLLVKPLTYVNRSGRCVDALLKTYKFPVESFLVVTDDLFIPFGQIRIKPKGSSGGHNGIQSIAETLESEFFPRMRLGIGYEKNSMMSSFVLSEFTEDEQNYLPELQKTACNAIITWVELGLNQCMNKYNQKTLWNNPE